MRSREYRLLRQAGLMAAKNYRIRMNECDRILTRGLNMQQACKWMVIREDWARRLHTERRLMQELRKPNGEHHWRLCVIEMRPRGSVALLVDAGVDSPGPPVYICERKEGGLR